MLGKRNITCCYEHYFLSVRQGEFSDLKEDYSERGALGSPSWIHGQARG
jgi:hypothetical protein